jgi:type 1 glutamine amidotransferase
MKTGSFLLIFLCTVFCACSQEKINENSLKDKQVLYVYGGMEGHMPKESVALFVPWLESEGAIVTVSDSLGVYTNAELMAKMDLIIQIWTIGEITNEQFNGLRTAISNGTGFSGWHGGIGDAFRNNLEYQYLVGGQFLAHPGGRIDFEVNIRNSEDPITKGIDDFQVTKTEQYYMLVDPNLKVLATTTFASRNGSVIPVVWKKNYGKGRVFYQSIGHDLSEFKVPELMEIQKRGFRWAAQGKYQKLEKLTEPVYK